MKALKNGKKNQSLLEESIVSLRYMYALKPPDGFTGKVIESVNERNEYSYSIYSPFLLGLLTVISMALTVFLIIELISDLISYGTIDVLKLFNAISPDLLGTLILSTFPYTSCALLVLSGIVFFITAKKFVFEVKYIWKEK